MSGVNICSAVSYHDFAAIIDMKVRKPIWEDSTLRKRNRSVSRLCILDSYRTSHWVRFTVYRSDSPFLSLFCWSSVQWRPTSRLTRSKSIHSVFYSDVDHADIGNVSPVSAWSIFASPWGHCLGPRPFTLLFVTIRCTHGGRQVCFLLD